MAQPTISHGEASNYAKAASNCFMEANVPERLLVWGGLAAKCSECGWERVYRPGSSLHQLPGGDLAEAVKKEFDAHVCETAASRKAV